MLTDQVLHSDLLSADIPAAVVFNIGESYWEAWTSGIPEGMLQAISDLGLGTVYESGEQVPAVEESVMTVELEFAPEDIGSYPFTVTPALVESGVDNTDLPVAGTGIWNDRTVSAVPSSLSFTKTGSVVPAAKQIELSVSNRKAVLDTPEGESSSPAFEVEAQDAKRILQPAVNALEGVYYYLHEDGSINTNPNDSLGAVCIGIADGKWQSLPGD